MALGTNYARTGRRADLLTQLGLHRMVKEGWTRTQVDEERKTLRYKKVSEILQHVKAIKDAHLLKVWEKERKYLNTCLHRRRPQCENQGSKNKKGAL